MDVTLAVWIGIPVGFVDFNVEESKTSLNLFEQYLLGWFAFVERFFVKVTA